MTTMMDIKKQLSYWVVMAILLCLPCHGFARVATSGMFGSHMVLQQGMEVPVWGTAEAGEEVTVNFDGQTVKTKAGNDGKWMLKLGVMKAKADQTGQSMAITGDKSSQKITYEDVLIGEVWVASGQSNMHMRLQNSTDALKHIAGANHPQIRLAVIPRNFIARQPAENVETTWEVCTPDTASPFSGVAYFFAQKLHSDLGVPIGVINNSVSGTPIQAWISHTTLHEIMPNLDKVYAENVFPGELLETKIEKYNIAKAKFQPELDELLSIESDQVNTHTIVDPSFNDSKWETMELPGMWSQRGLGNFQGMLWYRKHVQVPTEWAGKDLVVHLGGVSSFDVTWFNGSQIGETGSQTKEEILARGLLRSYRVPGKLVKAGDNVIAVRLVNFTYAGGFIDSKETPMKLTLAGAAWDDENFVSLAGPWKFQKALAVSNRPGSPESGSRPGILFNNMVSPVIPYGIRGALWYQGEANTYDPMQYRTYLKGLIDDWRMHWGQGDFPVLVVQLPGLGSHSKEPGTSNWIKMRMAQAVVAQSVPHVGLAVTWDVGDPSKIHPENKYDVGRRLALIAEADTYGVDVVASGPTYKSHVVKGNQLIVTFDHVHGGLVAKGDKLEGFAIAGEDGKFVWADAVIQGDSVILSAQAVPEPVTVSFGWDGIPPLSFYNVAGLPGAPFKTDEP